MKKLKRLGLTISVSAIVLASGIGVALASDVFSPAEKLSELTGTSVEAIYEAKGDKTYGEIASENGVLDEFSKDMLENKKTILDQRVAEGKLTQKEADEIYSKLLENKETCDGSGNREDHERLGLGFGGGNGMGNRNGMGNGNKTGQ